MGDDFSSLKVFADSRPEVLRARIVEVIPRNMNLLGFVSAKDEEAADRSFVVGPANRWIHIGDTAGTTETADPDAFDELALALSRFAPIVSLKCSDSAAIHFELREEGRLIDVFGNMRFPFYYFTDAQEASRYSGRVEAWQHLLRDRSRLSELRQIWTQAAKDDLSLGDFHSILHRTSELLGLDQDLLGVGYTNDMDGVPLKYDEFLPCSGVSIEGFEEFHFVDRSIPR